MISINNKRLRAFSVLALLLFALVGLRGSEAAEEPVLHVGISPFEAQVAIYYAIDQGFFKQVGLNVDVTQLGSGSAVAAAIVGGSLQIGCSNALSLANAREHGFPFVYIAPGYMYDTNIVPPYTALVVSSQSTITNGRDFEGKAIAGTASKSLDDLATRAWIDQHNGNSSNVGFIEMPLASMPDAVASGRVAGAIIAEPALSKALATGNLKILGKTYDAISKRFMVVGWFTTEDWATKNAAAVRKFALAMNQASAWAVKNPELAANIERKYIRTTYARAHEYHVRSLDPALIQPMLDAAMKYKLLDRPEYADKMIFAN